MQKPLAGNQSFHGQIKNKRNAHNPNAVDGEKLKERITKLTFFITIIYDSYVFTSNRIS